MKASFLFGPGGFMMDSRTLGIIVRLATDQHAQHLTVLEGTFGGARGLRLSLKCPRDEVREYTIIGDQVSGLSGSEER